MFTLLAGLAQGQPRSAATTPVDHLLASTAHSPTLEQDLRVVCDQIGARMAGTPGMAQAVDWAAKAFQRAGVDEVHTESFTIANSWREGPTQIEITAPIRFSVRGASSAWVPATLAGGLEAEVVDAGFGSEGRILRLGAKAKGKILLLRSREAKNFHDLAETQRGTTIALREAQQVDAAALVFVSNRPRGLLYRQINTVDGTLDTLPTALLAREDGLRIARLIEGGETVRMRLSLPNDVGGPLEQQNVVAEIRGREKPQEVVIVGAHLDSWDLGTGCLDNGTNVALVIEVARSLAAADVRPRRTVRFILFGAEEQGLLGSHAYVRAHRDELHSVVAVVIHDMGVGKIKGYSLGGRRDIEHDLVEAMEPVAGRGANAHSFDAFFGTDHFDFLLEGIPTLLALQDTSEYVPNYHSSADTFDKIDLAELQNGVGIAAVTVYNLADRPERFGKRLNREQVEHLLEDTRLDEQLKFLGLWDDWTHGGRGRQPNER